ncbi:uncharacterized protein [Pocillopora verrucosa]|uniref:uncharacterized protein isoform X2 n=1 Tax=Pocillopora verrucosa TaxID=203993 RepID=UPI00333E8D0E
MEDEAELEECGNDEDNLLSESLDFQSSTIGSKGGSKWKLLVYLQCYFSTIAAVLGTGIIGFPLDLSQSGYLPVIVVLLTETLVQILIVLYFLELLQRSYQANRQDVFEPNVLTEEEDVPLNDMETNDDEEQNAKSEMDLELCRNDKDIEDGADLLRTTDGQDVIKHCPSLHTMAELFLQNGTKQLFKVIVLLMFVSVLINYALAGSQACLQLLNLRVDYGVTVLVWSCAFLIIFINFCVLPFVSLLTFGGGCLILAVTVWATLNLESHIISVPIFGELKYVGQPLVSGTITMGGIVNILPVLFAKIKPYISEIRWFYGSVIAGVLTYVTITTFWVARYGVTFTYPLAKIVGSNYPAYGWIPLLIQILLIISVTVSFLTMGTGLKHMVDSWFNTFYPTAATSWQNTKREGIYCCANIRWLMKIFILLSLFGFVFAVAVLNPVGTASVLGNVASLTSIAELGVFLIVMLRRANSLDFSHLRVPVPLSLYLYHLQYPVILYFLVAFVFNITEVVQLSLYGDPLSSSLTPQANQSFPSLISSAGANSSLASSHNRQWRIHDTSMTNATLY